MKVLLLTVKVNATYLSSPRKTVMSRGFPHIIIIAMFPSTNNKCIFCVFISALYKKFGKSVRSLIRRDQTHYSHNQLTLITLQYRKY